MKERRLAFWTALLMGLLGAACVGGRWRTMHGALIGRKDTAWRITCEVTFRAPSAGARIHTALPENGRFVRVFGESFSHPGLATDILRSRLTRRREAVAVATAAAVQATFIAEFDIQLLSEPESVDTPRVEELSATAREHYLRTEKLSPAAGAAVDAVRKSLARDKMTRNEMVKYIFNHCSGTIAPSDEAQYSEAGAVLEHGVATPLGRAKAMAVLCRAARLPARLVSGLVLSDEPDARPHVWVEVYAENAWLPYDPENGYPAALPPAYLPLREDGEDIVRDEGAEDVRTTFSIRRLPAVVLGASHEGRWVDVLDLKRLSPGMQQTVTTLLLLPIGALVTAVFRNLIGVQTFGTFAPTLLALSFVRTDMRTGLVLFILVLGGGLGVRALLNRLKLPAVPRLGIVLTLVISIVILAVSVLAYLGRTPSAHAVLLPMVILTMMVEHFYIIAEEDGHRYALELLTGTLAVAACCLLVLRWERLGRIVLMFPEVHLLTIGALILVGWYAGFRVSELWRFRDLSPTGPEDRP